MILVSDIVRSFSYCLIIACKMGLEAPYLAHNCDDLGQEEVRIGVLSGIVLRASGLKPTGKKGVQIAVPVRFADPEVDVAVRRKQHCQSLKMGFSIWISSHDRWRCGRSSSSR